MPRLLKWTTIGLASVLLLALTLVATVALILNTESGTRWAMNRIEALAPGELDVGNLDGTLWRNLSVATLDYRDADRDIRVTGLRLRIDWSLVPAGRLMLSVLSADDIEYRQLAAAPPEPQPFELTLPPLPVAVGILRSRIGRIVLIKNEQPTEIGAVSLDSARLEGSRLQIKAVAASTAEIAVSATNVSTEIVGDVATSADVSWRLLDDSWSGSGTLHGSLASLQFEHTVTGPYPASAAGSLQLLHRVDPLVDAVVIPGRWSFGDYVLQDSEVRVRGIADNYDGSFTASVLLPTGQDLNISGTASGDTRRLSTFAADIQSQAGQANLMGTLAWAPALTAELRVAVSEFDPAQFDETLSGRLAADANVTLNGTSNVSVSGLSITGVLNGAAIVGAGELALTGQRLQCDECMVAVGANTIQFAGTAEEEDIALSLAVDAPSLAEFWPTLSGALTGRGQLSGTRSAPNFAGEFRGQRLRFADWSTERVVLQSRTAAFDKLDVTASLTALSRGDTDLGSGTVRAVGQLNQLGVDVDWAIREVSFDAQGNLNRGEDRIDGTVRQLSISEPTAGTWSLAEAFSFHVDTGGWQLDPHRWAGPESELRVTRAEAVDDELALAARLVDLPLRIANPFLPQTFRLQGLANADLDVTRRDGAWFGTLEWRQSDTVLTVLEAYDEATDVRIPRAEVTAELRDGRADVGAALTIEPGVTAELEFVLQGLASDATIVAELRMQGQDWAWVPAILPQIDNIEGSIAALINASGPLQSPEFSGELSWRQGRLVVPALNVPVSDIDLVVSGASDGAAMLAGSAKAGEGQLAVNGRFVDVMQSSRSVSLKLTGETAELINWPEYHVWASPDLVINGTAEGWTVNGDLIVPRADIAFRELPVGAVAVSPDVVVIGAEQPAVRPTRYSGEARLVLGERVHWDALGLDARLSGKLLLRKAADRALTAEGEVALLDGVFEAYGQKLTIQQGTLTFTGALDDPIVSVRAVRVIETLEGTVTAGIHVRGRATNLTSSVFAEPAMAEADALSYLVIGRPLSQATSSEGNELSGAALSLGIKQATRLTEQIGQTLGLDQLSLTGDGGDTTALVAGKQINPRMYARYVYGVFSRLGNLLLRYKLSRRLSLEAGTGEIQSLELLYSVEKD